MERTDNICAIISFLSYYLGGILMNSIFSEFGGGWKETCPNNVCDDLSSLLGMGPTPLSQFHQPRKGHYKSFHTSWYIYIIVFYFLKIYNIDLMLIM